MKRQLLLIIFLLFSSLFLSQLVHAEVEWKTIKELKLQSQPLDFSPSADGKLIFILAPGEILIYSVPQEQVINRIPVEKGFDKLIFTPRNNRLIVKSTEKQTLTMIQLEFSHNIDISERPFKGSKEAPVTIAVFSDYQCPYCARLEPVLQQVLAKYPKDTKLVLKHFPLPMHKFARKASAATLAAAKQGKFWQFHEETFKNLRTLNDAKVQKIAQELGLNLEQFNNDLKDPAIQKRINEDINNGRQAGVRGTPAIFVNGKRLKNRSLAGFQRLIELELKKNSTTTR